MTSVTEPSREDRIQQALASVGHYQHETRTLRLHGKDVLLDVVDLPIELVLLNPHNHRIRAQMGALTVEQQQAIQSDPYGEKSQTSLETLVRETDGFSDVLGVMANEGQREPGIITTKGVLINANTRVVALRDNKKSPAIQVLVLPPDVSNAELLDLEFTLQMQRESKQDYSFSNRLLFIEELLNADRQPEDIGQIIDPSLNQDTEAGRKKARQSVEREMRMLVLARLVVAGSQDRLAMTWFDERRQALIEVDSGYQALVSRDADEARRIRDAQLAAMISGVDYRTLRKVDSVLLDRYLGPALAAQAVLKDHASALLEEAPASTEDDDLPPGLDIIFGTTAATGVAGAVKPSLDRIYKLLALSADAEQVMLPPLEGSGDPTPIERDVFTAALIRAIEVAIDNRSRDDAKSDDLTAPIQFLDDAKDSIDKARRAHLKALGRNPDEPTQHALPGTVLPGYQQEAVVEAVEAVERALDDLRAELA